MNLQDCITLVEKSLGINFVQTNEVYSVSYEGRTLKIFQRNNVFFLEGSLGHPLVDDIASRSLLGGLLQFNLKRMRFLEGNLYLDDTTQQLFFQQRYELSTLLPPDLETKLDDFFASIEVIEQKFFPKKPTNE